MKSTSQAGIVLVLVMLLLVLASLFWFLYSDYDAVREQADLASSRATRVAAMELEAGQLRAEADQVKETRSALDEALATAVTNQELLGQESVNDQQTIQLLETRVAEQTPADTIPEIIVVSPIDGSTFNVTDSVELIVAVIDPNGVNTIKIIFDGNPTLEIPVNGETSVIIQEPWPHSDAGEHTVSVTAVNTNNISSHATTITIHTENKPTSQQIIDEVANIIGPSSPPTTTNNEAQVSATLDAMQASTTSLILQAFDFAPPQAAETTSAWGIYCNPDIAQTSTSPAPQDVVESPAKELAMVQAITRDWQESQYQFSQLLADAPHDDARAALCALAAGHERWVLEEYIRRAAPEQQTELRRNLTPQTGFEDQDILTAQQYFGSVYGPDFFTAITTASGTTAVLDAWNRPPQSSAQILNPSQYAANSEQQAVTLPDLTAFLGDEWTLVKTNMLGAYMLAKYLENFVEPDVAETAVTGWQGDQYAIYQQGDGGPILLALQLTWATEQDAQNFASVYEEYVNGRFAGTATAQEGPGNSTCWTDVDVAEETICLFTNETQTLLVRAPENNLAVDSLAEIIGN